MNQTSQTAKQHTSLKPTPRELRWFAHIDRHGPQSSEFLYELTRDTHLCKDTALRRLQALREAGFLHLPRQQRKIARADFHPYVYDLTPQGFEYLSYYQSLERHIRPTGHWWHGYWVSCVTSAIEMYARNTYLQYLPAARILNIKNATLGIPLKKGKLIPDQLFAIKYPEGYRAFALEMDCGTEPVRSSAARKSLQRSVAQYREVLEKGLHRQHYGLNSNLMILWVFQSHAREGQFPELIGSMGEAFRNVVVDPDFPSKAALNSVARSLISF